MSETGNYQALVLAGGSARRMSSDCPKALLPVNGRPLLEFTLSGLNEAGLSPILVMTDRLEYFGRTVRVASRFPRVDVMPSRPAESTLQVVLEAVPWLASRFMFIYGHAPRFSAHYNCLFSVSARTIVTRTSLSSKRTVIAAKTHGFIEPPYVLEVDDLPNSCALSWTDFFLLQSRELVEVPLVGPNEFNSPAEYRVYSEYVSHLSFSGGENSYGNEPPLKGQRVSCERRAAADRTGVTS
jgi:hypothetical protein